MLVTYGTRERDIHLERVLSLDAAYAVNLSSTGGIDEYADLRAHPGGVRADLDADQEAREELADARNYLLWGIEPIYAMVRSGRSQYAADYERRMRALSHVHQAWHALHTEPH